MRHVVEQLEASRIREVANEGLGRDDVLKFWFGESDESTPVFIRDAAIASLQAGETFYAHNLGLQDLRVALAIYTDRLHPGRGRDHWFDRLAVTSGGVNGLMLAAQTLVEAGDEVGVAEPDGAVADHGRPCEERAIACSSRRPTRRRLGARYGHAAGRHHPGNPHAGGQRAEQPHGLGAQRHRATHHP